MKTSVEHAVHAEVARHTKAMTDLINRNPEYRSHLAYALLGSAIAVCDSYGVDTETFIAHLRATHDKPEVLVPPMMRRS